ncbi:hypothetical protein E2626_04140 [Jeotgalibacillus salarius]|uniref:Uncharacterized protein n=2 Tax=Jeotgalibacillus salarius TaxID=546023 RepID=A0A4Y8LKS5_9BACL|nr:hypothetical protein E2626_04140 [Jeotgalibacillus salarius]
MEKTIISEWNDENTHPRVRRRPEEKYQITIQLIRQSDLNEEEQYVLIDYLDMLFQQNFNN